MKNTLFQGKLHQTALLLFFFLSFKILPAQINVSGRITYQSDGTPVYGATIVETGSQNGTISDSNGRYSITVRNRDAALRVAFTMGIPDQVISVGDRTVIDIVFPDVPKTMTKREKRKERRGGKKICY